MVFTLFVCFLLGLLDFLLGLFSNFGSLVHSSRLHFLKPFFLILCYFSLHSPWQPTNFLAFLYNFFRLNRLENLTVFICVYLYQYQYSHHSQQLPPRVYSICIIQCTMIFVSHLHTPTIIKFKWQTKSTFLQNMVFNPTFLD